MPEKVGNGASEELLDVSDREPEARPIVPVFHDLQHIAIDRDVAIEVHLVESLHGDGGPAMVLLLVLLLLESEVMLDGLARELGLLASAGRILGGDNEEGSEDRQVEDQGEEDEGLESAAELVGGVARDQEERSNESWVRERVVTISFSGERGIGDRGKLLEHELVLYLKSVELNGCCGVLF